MKASLKEKLILPLVAVYLILAAFEDRQPFLMAGPAILVPILISAALSAASMGIQYLTMRKMKQPPLERGRNDDIRIMGSDYGAYIPRIWGRVRFAPQLIYSTGIRVERIESTQRTSGGKGGPPPQKVIDYNYYTTIQLLGSKGEGDITKIWAGTDLIFSLTPSDNLYFFEAENGTLIGGASIVSDALCSNGQKVTLDAAGEKVSFTLGAAVPPTDEQLDEYTMLTIYYRCSATAQIGVAIDGGSATNYTVHQSILGTPATFVVRIPSHPSTVQISYAGSVTVSIDRMTAWFSYTDSFPQDLPVTGIEDPLIQVPDTPDNRFFPHAQYNYMPTADGTGRTTFAAVNATNVRLYSGTATQTQDAAIMADLDSRFGSGQGALRCSAHRGYNYAVLENYLIPNGQLPNFTFEVNEGTTSVADIVTDLYAEKNIDSGDLDLTALAGLTRSGLIVSSLTSPQEILNHMQTWYRFKMIEMDGKIKAVLNFSTPALTIARTDLRAHIDSDTAPDADSVIVNVPEEELPETVYVNYLDSALEGKNNTQQSDLYASTLALETVSLSFPFTSTETEAKGAAEHLLLEAHARRTSHEFFLGPKHARRAPGDCIVLDLNSGDHPVQITKEQKSFAGVTRYNAVSIADANVTEDTTTATNVSDILYDAARFPPNTEIFAFESQPVELFHEGLGFYVGVCGIGVGRWDGCGLYHALTTVEDPNPIATIRDAAAIGDAQSALGDHSGSAEDTTNDLTIYFYNDIALETVTADELDQRPSLNLIRIGDEWVQFRTADAETLPAGSTYRSAWTISNLRRGLFGTDDKRASHVVDEACCTYNGMRFCTLDSRYYGASALISAVTIGRSFDLGSSVSVPISGKSLQGTAPSDLPGRINNSACVIVQNGTATNTTVNITVSQYSSVSNYRKVEYSTVSDLSSGVTETIINGFELANFLLPQEQVITTTSLSSATVKYIAISHSPDGINWSPRSNIIAVTFASSGGSGGGTGDTPPTFTSVAYDTPNSEVDLVFVKNGTATGNIQVEYKLTSDSTWTLHGTEFAHGATSGSVLITEQPTAQTYDLRLSQVGVSGYSTTRQVTVDAAPGGSTPPDGLTALAYDDGSCGWTVDLTWTAGSGAALYTVERKLNAGSWSVISSTAPSTGYSDNPSPSASTGRTYYYRVKQNDVPGYSNTDTAYISRCIF